MPHEAAGPKLGSMARENTSYGNVRKLAVGVGLPLAVSALALLPVPISPTVAAMVFVLAVTAAALAGTAAGLTASILSFVALNLFFTPPVGTLSVRKTEDVVALAVFLGVSAVIGSLLSRAIAQQARAERREREARLLQHLGGRLLSGEPAESVLSRFGDAIVPSMDLAGYRAIGPDGGVIVERGSFPDDAARRFSMEARGTPVGAIEVRTGPSRPELQPEEEHLVRTFAAQMALALDASRQAADARAARTDAERSRVQAALLSSVTHDLRTPLASITASVTDLLDRPEVAQKAREQLETIRQEANRLNRVVGNLLDLTRIRAGALTPSKRRIGIDEVIEGVLGRMEASLSRFRVRLLVRDNVPEVDLDVVQVDQALTNILENAARFAPEGSEIHITVARWEGWVQVRIADQGPGIPEELRQTILEPFVVEADAPGAGTGLGLAIARAVMTAHGGRMWIELAPGGGTAVILRLPVED